MKYFAYTLLSLGLIFIAWQLYAYNSNKDFKTMDNNTLATIEGVEFRVYNHYTTASVPLSNNKMSSANGKFSVLAGYIFGGNKESQSIAMTSPVIYEMEEKSYFSFLMPESLPGEKLPVPNDPSIEFHDVVNQHVAVINFGGFANESKVKKYHKKLKLQLQQIGFTVDDKHIVAVYQPPYQLVGRENEIWIELKEQELKELVLSKK